MGPIKSLAALACSAVLLTSASPASAQTTQDRLTYVTFSGPVSIPGKTLPAGTYTFRLADSPSDRHIVQVFDKDQTKLYATLLAVPADRVEAEGDPVITFKETPSDRPPAVHYWYYAGERSGNEFVYPKNQAMMIASNSNESVMSVDTDSTDFNDWKNGQTSRISGNAAPQSGTDTTTASSATTAGSDTTSASQPATTTSGQSSAPTTTSGQSSAPTTTSGQSSSQPTTTSGQTSSQPSMTSQSSQPTGTSGSASPDTNRTAGTSGRATRSQLPHTASELPMVGLIGVFALAGALMLRVARRAIV
jgi:hypothetical protein